ncbi:fimbrial assembly protein [Mesorhizobium sp. M1B.F.Ca.ET.045.04.1.1]|nr:fimbrial assembly protein [Mesorhizobium sp. M1B.F.Ca.ET.045.04.1.1]
MRAIASRIIPRQKQTSTSDWIVALADDGIRVGRAGAPEVQSVPLTPNAPANEISTLLHAGNRRKRPSFDVLIHSGIFLTRQLGALRLPPRLARTMAELDLLASTPIDPAQVHLVFAASPEQGCSYHVVKTKTLSAVLSAIHAVGGTVRSIALVEHGQAKRVDRPSLAAIWPPTKREHLVTRAWAVACAILFLCLAATYAHAQWRYWQAGAALDEQIAEAQIQAKEARAILQKRQTELEQIDRIRAEKKSAVSTVRILAEVTHMLPDSAWVTDLSSKKGELTISGFAASAADLIQPIDASPLFSAPEFAAPVVKVPGQTGERFTITARIDAP